MMMKAVILFFLLVFRTKSIDNGVYSFVFSKLDIENTTLNLYSDNVTLSILVVNRNNTIGYMEGTIPGHEYYYGKWYMPFYLGTGTFSLFFNCSETYRIKRMEFFTQYQNPQTSSIQQEVISINLDKTDSLTDEEISTHESFISENTTRLAIREGWYFDEDESFSLTLCLDSSESLMISGIFNDTNASDFYGQFYGDLFRDGYHSIGRWIVWGGGNSIESEGTFYLESYPTNITNGTSPILLFNMFNSENEIVRSRVLYFNESKMHYYDNNDTSSSTRSFMFPHECIIYYPSSLDSLDESRNMYLFGEWTDELYGGSLYICQNPHGDFVGTYVTTLSSNQFEDITSIPLIIGYFNGNVSQSSDTSTVYIDKDIVVSSTNDESSFTNYVSSSHRFVGSWYESGLFGGYFEWHLQPDPNYVFSYVNDTYEDEDLLYSIEINEEVYDEDELLEHYFFGRYWEGDEQGEYRPGIRWSEKRKGYAVSPSVCLESYYPYDVSRKKRLEISSGTDFGDDESWVLEGSYQRDVGVLSDNDDEEHTRICDSGETMKLYTPFYDDNLEMTYSSYTYDSSDGSVVENYEEVNLEVVWTMEEVANDRRLRYVEYMNVREEYCDPGGSIIVVLSNDYFLEYFYHEEFFPLGEAEGEVYLYEKVGDDVCESRGVLVFLNYLLVLLAFFM